MGVKIYTEKEALDYVFSLSNSEAAENLGIKYMTFASYKKRYKEGKIKEKTLKEILALAKFKKYEQAKYTLK